MDIPIFRFRLAEVKSRGVKIVSTWRDKTMSCATAILQF